MAKYFDAPLTFEEAELLFPGAASAFISQVIRTEHYQIFKNVPSIGAFSDETLLAYIFSPTRPLWILHVVEDQLRASFCATASWGADYIWDGVNWKLV